MKWGVMSEGCLVDVRGEVKLGREVSEALHCRPGHVLRTVQQRRQPSAAPHTPLAWSRLVRPALTSPARNLATCDRALHTRNI